MRWLRPEYPAPRYGSGTVAAGVGLDLSAAEAPLAAAAPAPWPPDAIGQIGALRQLAASAPITVDEAVGRFVGAQRDLVVRHLETLAVLGEVQPVGDGRYGVPVGAY